MDMMKVPVPNPSTLRFFIPSLLDAAKAKHRQEREAVDMKIRAKLEAGVKHLQDEAKKDPGIDKVIVIFAPEKSNDPQIKEWVAEKDRVQALMFPTEACYEEEFIPREGSLFYALDIGENDVFEMCDPDKTIDMGVAYATVLSGEELTKFKHRLVSAWEHADKLSVKMLALHAAKCAGCEEETPVPKDYENVLEEWSSALNEKYRSLLILLQSAERTKTYIVISPPVDDKLVI